VLLLLPLLPLPPLPLFLSSSLSLPPPLPRNRTVALQ
jgi:hypothetical protein